jgi:hypothetical protein
MIVQRFLRATTSTAHAAAIAENTAISGSLSTGSLGGKSGCLFWIRSKIEMKSNTNRAENSKR